MNSRRLSTYSSILFLSIIFLFFLSSNLWAGEWTFVSSGFNRTDHTAVIYNNKIYVFGGTDKIDDGYLSRSLFWEYNITQNQWTELDSGPVSDRDCHSAVVYEDRMFVFAGHGYDMEDARNDLWEYNFTNQVWTKKTSGPPARYNHVAVLYDGKMFVFGGFGGNDNELNDLWEYDIAEDRWRRKADSIAAIASATAVVKYDKIYVLGGLLLLDEQYITQYLLQEYDFLSDSWVQKEDPPFCKAEHTAVAYDDRMYVFGGATTLGENGLVSTNNLLEYNFDTGVWNEVQTGNSPPKRGAHTAVVYVDKMYVHGGVDAPDGTAKNDLWSYSFKAVDNGSDDEDDGDFSERIILSGEDQEKNITSDSNIIGTGAAETLNIDPDINVSFTAGDGDRVNLPHNLNHYEITSMGNHIWFSDVDANKVVTIIVTGTSTVGFADGSTATLEMVFSPGGPPQVQLGGAIVGRVPLDHDLVELWFESDPHPDTITNSIGMTFNYIEPGTFMMGSPEDEPGRWGDETQHQVTLTQGYNMQTTPVTQGQWEAVMGENPSYFSDCGADCPVEMVSWNDAQDFIAALNALEGTTRYALPTEAQWEYAARAGSTTAFANGQITHTGSGYDPVLDSMGWYLYNSEVTYAGCYDASIWGGSSCAGTHPVAQKDPNAWGLYDMHGNVREWVADWYGTYPTTAVMDPTGPASPSSRLVRGGAWPTPARHCRSALRYLSDGGKDNGFGFRLVLLPGH